MGNGSYVYKESNMSKEELYLEKRLISFFKELGYAKGDVLRDEISKKRLKQLIETRFLMDDTKEERKVIFGELLVPFSPIVNYFYLQLLTFWSLSSRVDEVWENNSPNEETNIDWVRDCWPFKCSSVVLCPCSSRDENTCKI